MKHKWSSVIACAWIMWEADVDPNTTLDKHLSSLGAFGSKTECEEEALGYAKRMDIAIGALRSKELVFHQVLGNAVEAKYKIGIPFITYLTGITYGTHEVTRWECWPSDFDPTKSIPKLK